ncbi:MAG: type II secretion system secretin GspD [Gallionella sp.]|nr:type II secretion system secretin GspD [Gallionella sp.]MDD4957765.1 type II secretion system secretin GspD [Gallionella sp.]
MLKLKIVVFLLLSVLLIPTSIAREEDKITLNFVNTDIESVIKAVGMISGKNFIIDPRVKGNINIVSSSPVSKDLTYQILLSALRLQGFSAIENGNVVRIIPEADAKQSSTPVSDRNNTVSGDKIITQVYPLRYESASQLIPVLRPLIGPNNSIVAYPNTNTLVMTDYADNIRRLNKIIDAIDQPNNGEFITLKLTYASAVDLAQMLNKLFAESATPGVAAEAGRRVQITADARTNSLLVRSDNPALMARARTLVIGLDVPTSSAGNIHVVYLRNAEAPKLAQTLRAIMNGDTTTAAAPAAGQTGALPTGGAGVIQADVATNSLIITAPDNLYNTLRAVIDKLDARRAQVYVEALIAEVTTDKAAEFGIQWQNMNGLNGTTPSVIGGTNLGGAGTNIIGAATNITSVGRGINIGIVKGQVNIPGLGLVANLGVLARALQADANANILSTPNLLTLDNEEAKIVIGKNVPFVTGQYAQTGTAATATPFQTIERKDVGLTLRVKPQISEGGTVRLQIYQEVSSIDTLTTNTAGVVTNKRSIDSTVLVDDGRIIVLGGLIQDDVKDSEEKVPILGDIPILGNLFKYQKRQQVKTNLMVFLRPFVLKNAEASATITGDRYEFIRNLQGEERLTGNLLPNMKMPVLPEVTFDVKPK